jgi:hypothetical protein
MKVNPVITVLLGILWISILASCKKEQTTETEQSEVVERYLEFKTKMNAMNASSGQMSNFLSIIGASQLRNNGLQLKSATGDSVVTDTVPCDTSDYWDYWTCATVTEFDNGDGTFTTIYDYGDGCDEFGYLAKGKITYIWKNVGNDYYSKVLYDHYYNYGMEMNGYSEYSFISDGNSYFEYDSAQGSKDSLVSPGIVFYWSGTSTGKDDISIVYDNGEKYTYTSNYSNKWDNSTYTVLEGEYTCISEPDGYEYHYLVTTPLFYNYACTNTWVAVSGVETIHYKDVAESYDFLIDYGNGNCDNLATITENGETSVVDFGELIYEYCGEDVVSDSTTAYPGR